MIKKYSLFLEGLLTKKQEVPYYFSERLRDLFLRIYGMDIPMSGLLLSSENNSRVKDDITFIDITDKDDTISFIQVNRLSRMKDEEEMDLEYWCSSLWIDTKSTLDSKAWKEQRTEMGVGRFFTRFYQKSSEPINDKVKEVLVNAYKSSYKSIKNSDTRFELVKGEDIRKWYLEDRYEMSKGQLSSSCMRYERCQSYLDIYVKNPDVCSLLILHGDDSQKIVGRALVWKLSKPKGGSYLDRIYTHLDADKNLFIDWAKKNDIKNSHFSGVGDIEVQLGNQSYSEFPYMDTFKCYNNSTHILSSDEDHLEEKEWWELQDTSGGYTEGNRVWSEYIEGYIDREDAVHTEDDGWMHRDDARWIESRGIWVSSNNDDYVWLEYVNQYYHVDDCVFSEVMDTYILESDSVGVWVDSNTEDYILKDEANQCTKEVEIEVEKKLCLLSRIVYNPFTDTWLFKGDRLVLYYCEELNLYLTEEDAEKKGVKIDSENRRISKANDYVSSLIKIDDINPEKLLEYLKKVEPTEETLHKVDLLLREKYPIIRLRSYLQVSHDSIRVNSNDLFNLVKMGIWFMPPDSERRSDFQIRGGYNHRNVLQGNLASKEAKDFLGEDLINMVVRVDAFDTIVREASDVMIYDIITDPEMLKIFIKLKSI